MVTVCVFVCVCATCFASSRFGCCYCNFGCSCCNYCWCNVVHVVVIDLVVHVVVIDLVVHVFVIDSV